MEAEVGQFGVPIGVGGGDGALREAGEAEIIWVVAGCLC